MNQTLKGIFCGMLLLFSMGSLAEPIYQQSKEPSWTLVGSMYSETGNWTSPRWVVFVDESSISLTKDSGISVYIKMDFSQNPKCFPSKEFCSEQILIAYETHVLYCNSTSKLLYAKYKWNNDHENKIPTFYKPETPIFLEKNSPIGAIVQPAICGKVNSLIDMSPSFIDGAMALGIVTSGGIELNAIAFPLKLMGEIYGANNKGTEECVIVVGGVRSGGCMGIGATAVGLAGAGPWGMVLGGVVGALICNSWVQETARNTCYNTLDKENLILKEPPPILTGFNG